MTVTASPAQLQAALSYCVDFAKTMLIDSSAFYPFGAIVNSAGDVEAVAGWTGDERPDPKDLHHFLVTSLRSEMIEGRAIASAVAVDVTIPEQYEALYRDAIRVTLETAGYSRFAYVPYQLQRRGMFNAKKFVDLAEPFRLN